MQLSGWVLWATELIPRKTSCKSFVEYVIFINYFIRNLLKIPIRRKLTDGDFWGIIILLNYGSVLA